MGKRLYRSDRDKILGGVCGGLGEYFEVDPVLIRIITVLLIIGTGVSVLAYVICWIVIPRREEGMVEDVQPGEKAPPASWHKYLPGLILIFIGVLLLVRENWYWFDFDELWPALFIILGLLLIFNRGKKRVESSPEDVKNHGTEINNGGSMV